MVSLSPLNGGRCLCPTNPFVVFKKTDIEQSLSDRFEQQVNLCPERTAIRNKGKALSYRSLNSIANRIALALLQTRGKREEPIALLLDNDDSVIAAILGVLKSGKIYVPLDSSLPHTRTQFILWDSQAELVLTNNKNLSLAKEMTGGKIQLINVDELDSRLSIENLDLAISPTALAYIIYTSGSTGRPKGVVETHRNLLHNIMTNTNVLHICVEDRMSLLRSIGATGAARDTFTPLLNGAILCPFPINEHGLANLARWLADEEITVFSSVITVFRHFVATLSGEEQFDKLRLIYAGGEQVTTKDIELYQKHFSSDCLFVNRLGVSETGTVAYYFIDKASSLTDGTVPVGYAAEDMEILLLDDNGGELGPNSIGEIAVRSRYLSPGYWQSPELTRSVFFPDPEGGDKRIYRTGDLGRKLPDGCLVHLGWKDFQVNIRGHRIDVAEVETALLNHPDVKEVAVVGREHWSGEIRLAAALVPIGNAVLHGADLRRFLKIRLPDYMIPSAFMLLDALPLGPNGKVDRRALPSPDWLPLRLVANYVAARTELEELIVGIWQETLGLDVVGVHDNFFDLGGHSLLLGQIVSNLQSAFNIDVLLGDFVEQPTVATLAEIIRTALRVNQGSIASITSVSRPRPLPLSFAQERLWFLDQLEPDTAAYNIPTATLIEGQLNVDAMEKALNEVAKRHEALRTIFTVTDGMPAQVILPELCLTLPVVNLSDLSETEAESETRRLITEYAQRPFDLSEAPLLRVILLKLSHNKHVFVTIHHLIADAWSIGILFNELSIFYDAYSRGRSSAPAELPVQYADFAIWQRQWLQGEALKSQVSYWKQQLADNLSVVELPVDRPRPVRESFRGARRYLVLAESLVDAIKDLSRRESVTLFMTLLAAFKTLLYRYSGREDVIVGSPMAGRNRAEVENLIGLFVNTLVMRTDFSGNPSFRELLRRVRAVCLGAYAHQDLPFEKLVEELQPERNLSRNPLFQVMFVLQNIPVSVINFTGLTARRLEVDSGTAKFDLTLSLSEEDRKLIGFFEYSTDLFDHSTIERMAGHFETLLEGIVADSDQQISNLPILTEAERRHLREWNETKVDYPKDLCIHELFEAQVERRPEAIAVEFDGKQLTYRDLNERADQLAHYLRGLGIRQEKLVGICVERSLEMVIGLLGILKAGGVYVPLDPSYPKERLAFMVNDAVLPVVVTQENLIDKTQHSALGTQHMHVCLDRDWPVIQRQNAANPETQIGSGNLAYVIYTSGSTGKPKGVQVSHCSVVNCLHSIGERLGFTGGDVLLAVSTISFDISVLELFLPLIVGGKVVIANREEATDSRELARRLKSSSATVLQATPSTWRLLMEADWEGSPRFKILVGGESMSRQLAEALLTRGEVWNLYGPTESTIWSAVHKVAPGEGPVPIGRPLANTEIYILDSCLQPVPIGVHGELCIGGDGLARGYLNYPELTTEKFVANLFSDNPNSRLYRTGDRAKYHAGGEIEFLGRDDNQVKIRGHRIELGEIEAILNQHPSVKESVVVALEHDSSEEKKLVGYIVPVPDGDVPVNEFRRFLQATLPDFMIPSSFVFLNALPLTPNDKIDRSALPPPHGARPRLDQGFSEPRTEIEELIAQVWGEVLNLDKIAVQDNFFELGGHSLLATRVVARLRSHFNVDLPLRKLFELPTVAGMAQHIDHSCRSGSGTVNAPIRPAPRDQRNLPSIGQELLLFLDELIPNTHLFNIPAVYRLRGPLDVEILARSLDCLIMRQEALRTTFPIVDGQRILLVGDYLRADLNVVDLQSLSETEFESQAEKVAREEVMRPFDLGIGPLFRTSLLRHSNEHHVFVVTMHHVVSDAVSMVQFLKELGVHYECLLNRHPLLKELSIQFADFARWQRQRVDEGDMQPQLAYWEQELGGSLVPLTFPGIRVALKELSFRTGRKAVSITGETLEALNRLSRAQGCTMFMTLLTAFKVLLYSYTRQEDIRVATLVANRSRYEVQELIGHFVNTIVLRTRVSADRTFAQLQAEVRETTLAGLSNDELPFESLLKNLESKGNLDRSTVAQVMLVHQSSPVCPIDLPGIGAEVIDYGLREQDNVTITSFDLILFLKERGSQVVGSLIYKSDLFDEAFVDQMLDRFHDILERACENPQMIVGELCDCLGPASDGAFDVT